jgi:iron complex outermembrane receptor protein
MPALMMTYRNFGRVAFYGLEAAAEVALNDRTSLSGSLSFISDDFFDHEELDEANEDLFVSLNAPTLKAGAGVSYRAPRGPSLFLSGRYVEGFGVRSGPYSGHVDDYFLLDIGAGYDFDRYVPGLRLDLTVQNAFDRMHREFIGAPKMGRLGIARLTYTL